MPKLLGVENPGSFLSAFYKNNLFATQLFHSHYAIGALNDRTVSKRSVLEGGTRCCRKISPKKTSRMGRLVLRAPGKSVVLIDSPCESNHESTLSTWLLGQLHQVLATLFPFTVRILNSFVFLLNRSHTPNLWVRGKPIYCNQKGTEEVC